MRFSVGGGIGPFRVSQRIGLGGRNNSRPGYFAQFEVCTIQHRSADTARRCGRRHLTAEQAAARNQTPEERAAAAEKRIATLRAKNAAKLAAKDPGRAYAVAEAKAGRQTPETYKVMVGHLHRSMAWDAILAVPFVVAAIVWTPWAVIGAAFFLFAFFADWRSSRRITPPVQASRPSPERPPLTVSQPQAKPVNFNPGDVVAGQVLTSDGVWRPLA